MPTFHPLGQKAIIFKIDNYRQQAISSNKNWFKYIIFKVRLRISPSDLPHHQEKSKFGLVLFLIFLHTFKVFLLLISAAACKKTIGCPETGSHLVRNSQKRMFLKCCSHQINKRNIALCSTDFDEFCRISTCVLQTSQKPNWCRQCWNMNFFCLYILQKLWTKYS